MKVTVNVFLKNGVLDPAGKAVEHALGSLGFDGVNEVRIGKQIVLNLKDNINDADIKTMCEELLANTVIEDYEIIKG
ncbi:phosphoribosylformylglycinamidine synthase%2C PurS protein [Campylobacter hyointestinalis subsp. hyointestinalis]|uniref:Phosphoribosylformylglycinamidine synthase subunit PurS n=1 Tax=Campylobacter hyointestinalis subsp. hyointestinalis TaxID=91352 RepID=A0A0S4R9Y0_CAMHY|nr:phosphoribosylformylglycinamidine synthase subunit PurS [Campylobacter hyointestinalis]PPB54175.1 phosphoribosylformylglycinamidine synthase subunit PurS [Campylobacter hyointestinalis subsp. hyointestinalis]PPB61616.1 phosphoribosylformylglycinamidine synthase subunit PurS [Campylobacter hyointestinalis subsp. hyointestinalis]PPB62816.1 phosphoribosylformylglycinamidine synthase subunit PurS [Campylobacter hyointestinalis subsp. hyointestinalis]CUU70033.1 phosphoribosylformylglycinamidine s